MSRMMIKAITKYQIVKWVFLRMGFFPPRSEGSLIPRRSLKLEEGF
jgi:hypothetical protein